MPRPFCLASSPASSTRLTPVPVHGYRLLHEYIFAGFNGRFEMDGPKMRWCRQDDIIDLRYREQLGVSVKTGEAHLLGDRNLQSAELITAGIEPVGKNVC